MNVEWTAIQRGPVAQLGARVNGIHEVTGSTPVWSTTPPLAAVPGCAVRLDQPVRQVPGGLVGGTAVEGHQGGRSVGQPHQVGAPAVGLDRRHFDLVPVAVDGFFEAMPGHGSGVVSGNGNVM